MHYIKQFHCMCREEVVGDFHCYPPLMSYLEALPPSYVNEKDICKNLSADGSLFQSPSATAKAFMAYGTQECLDYLQSLAQRCPKAGFHISELQLLNKDSST